LEFKMYCVNERRTIGYIQIHKFNPSNALQINPIFIFLF